MGGKSGSSPTSSTVTQTTIPDYAKPYFTDMLAKGQALTDSPYQAYKGDRLAGFSDQTKSAYQGIRGLGDNEYGFNRAMNWTQNANSYDPMKFRADQVGPSAQMGDNFGQDVEKFMNPYLSNVLDVQKKGAVQDYDRLKADRNASYVKAGAFGGSRSAVSDYLAEEGLSDRMERIDAEGLNSAYNVASNQALGAQQFNIDTRLRSDLANQDASLRADSLTDQSRQFDADMGIRSAGLLTDIGKTKYSQQLDYQKQLLGIGQDYQNMAQNKLDMRYDNFVNARDYPRQNLQFMAGLLRGVPINTNSSVQNSQYQSPFSSLLGTGITGYALSQLLGGQK